MTVFVLQIIAMVTMLCDHLGSPFFNNMTVLRCIGRFAFPIYALLVAEAYRHIKNDPKRLSTHLGDTRAGVISEIGYDLLECGTLSVSEFMKSQNCIITLLLGFLGLMAIDRWKGTKKLYMWAAIILTAMINFSGPFQLQVRGRSAGIRHVLVS